jgi:hypothetical protein
VHVEVVKTFLETEPHHTWDMGLGNRNIKKVRIGATKNRILTSQKNMANHSSLPMLSVPILALHADPDTQPRLESSFWPHGVLWHKFLESNQPQQLCSR